ncbi:MAG TPA: sigma-54 dependent transcriptional regulator [Candidatus Krumholzibacteria bacterium]|nr:sigma-54 dependent transcriptional regulator [Candidatus Krumholzibacteria bacterium]HRX49902.1 sigma-54 dependent transcriptional regulator [Candidatus Krumholzibacteria bacterium]
MARVLVIDDDRSLRDVMGWILSDAGHEVLTAADGAEGVRVYEAERPDLVLTDVKMPVQDGLDVLRHVTAGGAEAAPVIVVSAYGTVEQAVEAMKLGAFSYVLKPFNRDELRLTVEQALRAGALARENAGLRTLLRRSTARPALVYASDLMKRLMDRLAAAAASDAAVLIVGESGTGKELVARALHDLSPRWDHPFVPLNCGAIPENLMESELFGHARGAFTGAVAAREGRLAQADGGTLFLDEIGELPTTLQPKLLRVLETRAFEAVGENRTRSSDFRLVSATNRDLAAAVADGGFREDLYYRVGIVPLQVPSLRERPEDIPLLWEHFTELHGGRPGEPPADVLERLRGRPWRGNVRELKNLNQRATLLAGDGPLDLRALDEALAMEPTRPFAPAAGAGLGPDGLLHGPLPEGGLSLVELEKQVVALALARCGGNKSRAADFLRIPRHVLVYRIQKYGLES